MPESVTDAVESILSHSHICSGCLRRLRSPETYDLETVGTGDDELETTTRIGAGTTGQIVATEQAHGAIRTEETRTYCQSCGTRGSGGYQDTIDVQTAVFRAAELGLRLAERGIPVHQRLIVQLTERLKRTPDYAGRDDDVLIAAAKQAAANARPRDCVRATRRSRPRVGAARSSFGSVTPISWPEDELQNALLQQQV